GLLRFPSWFVKITRLSAGSREPIGKCCCHAGVVCVQRRVSVGASATVWPSTTMVIFPRLVKEFEMPRCFLIATMFALLLFARSAAGHDFVAVGYGQL